MFDPAAAVFSDTGHTEHCPRGPRGEYLCERCITCGWRCCAAGVQHVDPKYGPICPWCREDLPAALVDAAIDQFTPGAYERLQIAAELESCRAWTGAIGYPVWPGARVDALAYLRGDR